MAQAQRYNVEKNRSGITAETWRSGDVYKENLGLRLALEGSWLLTAHHWPAEEMQTRRSWNH